jgi:lipoprotein NlpI
MMRRGRTSRQGTGTWAQLSALIGVVVIAALGQTALAQVSEPDAEGHADDLTPRIKIGVNVAVFPSTDAMPESVRRLLELQAPTPRAVTVAAEFKMPWDATVHGYGFGAWDSRTPVTEAGAIAVQYPDFATRTKYNKPLRRTFIEAHYEVTPEVEGAPMRLQTRFEIDVLNEERTNEVTASIGRIDVGVPAESIVLVYLGTLSEIDARVPDDEIRRALHHEDRLTLGSDPGWAESSDSYILEEDRSTSHLILQIKPSVLIPNTTPEAVAAYRLIEELLANHNAGPHPDSIFVENLEELEDKIRWSDDSWRFVIDDRIAKDDPDLLRAVRLYVAWMYERRSWYRMRDGDLDAAEALASQSIELDSQRATAFLRRAQSRWMLDQVDGAASDVGQAVALAPDDAEAWCMKGDIDYYRGRNAAAVAAFSRALESYGDYPAALVGRGCALEASGKADRARGDFERLIELMPEDPIGYVHLGGLLAEQGNADAALERLNRAVELDPSHLGARYWRAMAYRLRGDLDAALDDLNVYFDHGPTNPYRRLQRGRLLLDMGRAEAAVAELLEACRVADPETLSGEELDYAQLYLWIASAQSGQKQEADARLRRHLGDRGEQIDPWPADLARFLLGQIEATALLARANESDESARAGRRCEAHLYCGVLYLLSGCTDDAEEAFRRAVATAQRDFYEYQSAQALLGRISDKD